MPWIGPKRRPSALADYRHCIEPLADLTERKPSWSALTRRARRRLLGTSALTVFIRTALLVTAYYVAPLEHAGDSAAVRIATSILIVLGAGAIALVGIANADYPIIRAIEAMSTFIVVTVLLFASAFVLMSRNEPAAFSELLNHTGALYFTLTTATTIGYGDISPKSEPARIAVMVQMLTNVLIVGVGLRLMVNTAKRRAMTV